MAGDTSLGWVLSSVARTTVLSRLSHPATATQVSRSTGSPPGRISRAISEFSNRDILRCLNPIARRQRVYWLTREGARLRGALVKSLDIDPGRKPPIGKINWRLYGEMCHRHRSAVLRSMEAPAQIAALRRRAVDRDRNLRMSANNARDVMRELRARQLVRQVPGKRRRSRPLYELSESGKAVQQMLLAAEEPRYSLTQAGLRARQELLRN